MIIFSLFTMKSLLINVPQYVTFEHKLKILVKRPEVGDFYFFIFFSFYFIFIFQHSHTNKCSNDPWVVVPWPSWRLKDQPCRYTRLKNKTKPRETKRNQSIKNEKIQLRSMVTFHALAELGS